MAESISGDGTVIDLTVTSISESYIRRRRTIRHTHTWYTYLPYHFSHSVLWLCGLCGMDTSLAMYCTCRCSHNTVTAKSCVHCHTYVAWTFM